jgi:phosphotransacetylase
MSAVINFPADRNRKAEQRESSGSAEVIIFPGVRIERTAFDLAERLPIARNGAVQRTSNADFDFY